ncbi:MAG: hypothetical protein IJ060_03325 [Oscillospiraceae bacterium]|nr:hypothetical protein [Oscillospiraceae bacterium]
MLISAIELLCAAITDEFSPPECPRSARMIPIAAQTAAADAPAAIHFPILPVCAGSAGFSSVRIGSGLGTVRTGSGLGTARIGSGFGTVRIGSGFCSGQTSSGLCTVRIGSGFCVSAAP